MKLRWWILKTRNTPIIVLVYLLYRVVLDISYFSWVSPFFGYDPYSGLFVDMNYLKLAISYLLVFIVALIIPKGTNKVSSMIMQLHFIVMIIPLSTIYALANHSTSFYLMVLFCFCMQIVVLKYLPLISLFKVKNAKVILVSLLSIFTAITFAYSLKAHGIQLTSFNFSSIYQIREGTKTNVIMDYLITWQYRIITPFFFLITFIRRKYLLSLIFAFMQVVTFLIYPHKEIIFSLIIIVFALFIKRKEFKIDLSWATFLSIGTIATIVIHRVMDIVFPLQTIVRLLYVPAVIKFQHYMFFLENQKLYYSEGMVGKVLGIEYPYSQPSGFLVAHPEVNNNTGYFAYAYDNAGFAGMIIISVCFVCLLVLIDSLVKNENKLIILAFLIYPMLMLNDGDLLTLLLTGGLFILLLILFIFKDIDSPVSSRRKAT